MTIIIYSLPLSAPCRLAYMTCELLGISYEKPIVDVTKGEQMEPWFKEVVKRFSFILKSPLTNNFKIYYFRSIPSTTFRPSATATLS
jgi:hypothetical protein